MASKNPVKTVRQVSAGGAVFRNAPAGLEIALISVGRPARWQLPKGLVDEGETPEAAAIREVREEAGVTARPQELVERVEYWYRATLDGVPVRYHKFVHFYLMWHVSGDVADHDYEVNDAQWFPIDQAIPALAFRSERSVVEKAATAAKRGGPQRT